MFAPMQRCTGGVDVVWDLGFFGLIDNWLCLGFLVWGEALRWDFGVVWWAFLCVLDFSLCFQQYVS